MMDKVVRNSSTMTAGTVGDARIEIVVGLLISYFREDKNGEWDHAQLLNEQPFVFVEMVDGSGHRSGLSATFDLPSARHQAAGFAAASGLPVVERNGDVVQ